jgi:hypothetical protein
MPKDKDQQQAAANGRQFKKISVERIKLEPGDEIQATLTGRSTVPWTDRKTGKVKDLTRLHFTREDGTKFLLNEDAGLRGCLADADVKDGTFIKLIKGYKSDLEGGHTVNNYEVFLTT